MKKNNLYFIAIVLPADVRAKVVKIEHYIAGKYNSHRSLKILPHVTLKAPFTWEAERHDQVRQWFSHLSIPMDSFALELKNFGCFQNRQQPVIFINPIPNQELHQLQSMVLDQFRAGFSEVKVMDHEFNFKPHVTVAYRDLSPEMFVPAWEEFRQLSFFAAFSVMDFHLLQHDGQQWNTIAISKLH